MNIYNSSKTNIGKLKIPNKSIILTEDSWDDWFSYETKFRLDLYVDNDLKFIGYVKIGCPEIKASSNQKKRTKDFFELNNRYRISCSGLFSIGQNSDYYFNINKYLKNQDRVKFYTTMGDMVYSSSLYKKYKDTNIAKVSLFRSVTDVQVTRTFKRIVTGKITLTNYYFKYYFPSDKKMTLNSLSLDFEVTPDSEISTNLHALIGRNGVGKTFIINNIISCFLKKKSYREPFFLFNKNNLKDNNLKDNNLKDEGLILYKEDGINKSTNFANIIHVSFSSFEGIDLEKRHLSEKVVEELNYTFVGINYNSYIESNPNNRHTKIQDLLCNKFMKNLAICLKNTDKVVSFDKVFGFLLKDDLFEESQIKSEIDKYKSEVLPKEVTKKELTSKDIEIREKLIKTFNKLSSGHKIILLSIITILAKIEECTLVLFDEPETHLHPPLLSIYVQSVCYLLKEMNAVGIIATHSPVILQEIPRKCVWIINRRNKYVSPSRPMTETLGKGIDSLTKEVFNFDINSTAFVTSLNQMELSKLRTYVSNNLTQFGLEGRLIMLNILKEREQENEKC